MAGETCGEKESLWGAAPHWEKLKKKSKCLKVIWGDGLIGSLKSKPLFLSMRHL